MVFPGNEINVLTIMIIAQTSRCSMKNFWVSFR
jgi:hypothetical protein